MVELGERCEFDLAARPPFDFYSTVESEIEVRRMEDYPPLVDQYDGEAYWTTMILPGEEIVGLRFEPNPRIRGDLEQGLHVKLYSDRDIGKNDLDLVRATVNRCWGLDEDMEGFYRIAGHPPTIGRVVQRHRGMRPLSSFEPFRTVCITILLQNTTMARTNAMISSLVMHYGYSVSFDGVSLRHWPSPERLAKVRPDEFRSECRLGFRAERLSSTSQVITAGRPDLSQLSEIPTEEAKELLMELKGIGEYSAEMILLGLRRWDVFPIDVWSTRQFYRVLFPGQEIPARSKAYEEVRLRSRELWGGWRGLVYALTLHELDEIAENP